MGVDFVRVDLVGLIARTNTANVGICMCSKITGNYCGFVGGAEGGGE